MVIEGDRIILRSWQEDDVDAIIDGLNNIEVSNTNVYNSTSEMLRLNASMLASMQMLKVVDQMYNKAINIREG